jgi:hypothetical protein
MRIIHEINTPMQVGGGAHGPYTNMCGFQGYKGGRIELFAYTDCASNNLDLPAGMFDKQELIEIEGNVDYLERMLEDMLSCVRLIKEEWEKMGSVRPTDCPNCLKYGEYQNATHTEECLNRHK